MTVVEFAEIQVAVREWFDVGHESGWINPATRARFAAIEQATSDDLFQEQEARPLVVALFGGTGVGKSSLLNRLAGRPIARVGVERPTSTEVTVYLHEAVKLADLPETLPLDRVVLQRHGDQTLRDLLWIDAPDIDSTVPTNREAALAWLPHIDLLIYVVSPERYRDDVGWRVLLERGHRHGWMFAMNRWDEGDPLQRDDFLRQVRAAGFDVPLLFTTSCVEKVAPDEGVAELRRALDEVVRAHGVRELTRLGHRARLNEMRTVVQQAVEELGSTRAWDAIAEDVPAHWDVTQRTLTEGLGWPMRSLAARLTAREQGILGEVKEAVGLGKRPAGEEAQPDPSEFLHLAENVWDEWAAEKLALRLDAVELRTRTSKLAVTHLRKRLDGIAEDARGILLGALQEELRRAFAWTGAAWQKWLRRVTGFLMVFLPFVAVNLVLVVLAQRFFTATVEGGAGYPGIDFAVASGLLVLLGWAVPYSADRLLKPSIGRAVRRALARGVERGLDAIGDRVEQAVADARQDALMQREVGEGLLKQLAALIVRPIRADQDVIARLVASRRSEARAAGETH